MGISFWLEDSKRTRVSAEAGDPKNLLHRILTDTVSNRGLLKFVDWYGYTIFNRAQMKELEQEIMELAAELSQQDELEILGEILELVRRGTSEPHRYLVFDGD